MCISTIYDDINNNKKRWFISSFSIKNVVSNINNLNTMFYLNRLFLMAFLLGTTLITYGQTLNIASYNLRYDNKDDAAKGNAWTERAPIIANLVAFHGFDIFGTQEGLYHQLQDLKNGLRDYEYVGVGRDDGKQAGEHSAIFYNTTKFDLVEHGDFWLSQDISKPNKGWDAVLPRICTWAKLRIKENGKELYFFNIHFDHVGTKARSESAKLILEKIKDMAANHTAILTGDFNVDQNSDSYKVLNTSGILRDAYELSPIKYANTGTFNNFNPNTKTESRIDHIFLTNDFQVTRYGVLTDTYRSPNNVEAYQSGNFPKEVSLKDYTARLPSDHFPVLISIIMPNN